MRFLDVFAGWPGRSHDSRVFRHNPLYQTLPHRLRKNPEGRLIESYHILGDSAFPVSPQVITPFKRLPNQDLNVVQKKFNRNLSSKCNVRTVSCTLVFFSACKQSLAMKCFYRCFSVIVFTGGRCGPGWVWSRVGAWSQMGGWCWVSAWARWVPAPRGGWQGAAGGPSWWTPPMGGLLLQAVRILLEYIIVS